MIRLFKKSRLEILKEIYEVETGMAPFDVEFTRKIQKEIGVK